MGTAERCIWIRSHCERDYSIHAQFLDAGGLGLLIGDGQLPHPGLEQIIETFYQFPIGAWKVMFDYQFVVNPAYNRDRGPVSIGGGKSPRALRWLSRKLGCQLLVDGDIVERAEAILQVLQAALEA